MLDERLKQIFHTALREKYETVQDTQKTDDPDVEENSQSQKKSGENEHFLGASTDKNLRDLRELKNPVWDRNRRSSDDSNGYQTPPYLSPGMTRRLKIYL